MSWSNDAVLEFLELYRREQVLWDPKHPLHRNRGEVTDAWLRIQSSLSINCSIVDLKKKKESLMTSFRMHFNKKKRSDEGYHTTWFAYPLMASFLGGKYECDSTNQMENEYFGNSASYSCSTQTAIPEHSVKNSNAERNNPSCRQYKPANSQPQTENKQEPDFAHAKKEVIEAVSYLKNLADERKESDECDLYGQLLAKKLRKLDERQRDVVMHEIDNIMFRAKMQSGSSLTRSYSPSPPSVPRKVKSPLFIVAQQTRMQFDDENVSYDDHLQPQAPS